MVHSLPAYDCQKYFDLGDVTGFDFEQILRKHDQICKLTRLK